MKNAHHNASKSDLFIFGTDHPLSLPPALSFALSLPPSLPPTLAEFESAGVDVSRSMVASCSSGVTAAHIALAAHTVGTQITVYEVSTKILFEGVLSLVVMVYSKTSEERTLWGQAKCPF